MAVETVNSVDNCHHLPEAQAVWIRNDPKEGPPVVLIAVPGFSVVATLTNQRIYLKCPECFRRLQELVGKPLEA
jgi:hypothetical protein